jgi:hypothetical protein
MGPAAAPQTDTSPSHPSATDRGTTITRWQAGCEAAGAAAAYTSAIAHLSPGREPHLTQESDLIPSAPTEKDWV